MSDKSISQYKLIVGVLPVIRLCLLNDSLFVYLIHFLGPLPGILADRYFGRPRMLSFCLLLCFLGSVAQSMFHTIFQLQETIPGLEIDWRIYYPVHSLILITLILGSSGITALLLPYGVDQMEDAGETRMSSYFYWFYWFVNLGSIMSFGRYIAYDAKTSKFSLLSISYLATVSSFLAAVVFRLSRSSGILQHGPIIGTPLKKIISVTKSSLVIWYQSRREENYHENMPILDYAKMKHFGDARFEIVEDVKSFYRIVFVLICLFGYYSIYHLLKGYYSLQAQELVRDSSPYSSSIVTGLTDSLVIIICIPIMRFCNYAKLYTAKILYRVQIGICLAFISVICANIIAIWTTLRGGVDDISTIIPQSKDDQTIPVLFVFTLPQVVIMGLSEIFAMVGTYEFVYAQSPGDMKGFTFGIMNTVYGLGTYFSTLLATILQAASGCPQITTSVIILTESCPKCAVPYLPCILYSNLGIIFFVIFSIYSLFYTVFFFLVATKYKRRDRQEIETWYCPN